MIEVVMPDTDLFVVQPSVLFDSFKRGMVMIGNLTHTENLNWKKGQKLVELKNCLQSDF